MLLSGLSLGLVKFGGVSLGTPPVNTVAPSITGTMAVYSTVNGSTGTWTGSPTPTYVRQWYISTNGTDFTAISGANAATYVITEADFGKYLRLEVTATNNAGVQTVNSSTTAAIAGTTPSNTVLPAISGTLRPGQVLTCSAGTWTSFPASTYTYQWLVADTAGGTYSNISGATASTYTLLEANVGKFIRCRVTASNGVGTPPTALANNVGPIQSNTVSSPVFTGVSGITYTPRSSSTPVPLAPLGTITNGELLIAHFFSAGTNTAPTITPPSGWLPVGGSDVPITGTDSSFNHTTHLYYKFANNESGTNYTFTYSGSRSTTCAIYKFFGVDPSTFSSVIQTKNSATTPAQTNTGTSLTTIFNNSMLLFFGQDWADGLIANMTAPSGMTETYEGTILYGAYQVYPTAGATGAKTMNVNAAINNPRSAWMLALNPSGAVLPDVAPSNVSVPTITGTTTVGATLIASSGTWNGRPNPTFTYQWQYSIDGSTNWTNISGATSSSYTIDVAYATRYLRVVVSASNTVQSNVTANSAATAQITQSSSGDWPNATNTGAKGTLTPWTGSNIITTNGLVIENRSFVSSAFQTIIVRASNVTIRNCLINNTASWWGIDQESGSGLRVEDCTLIGPGDGIQSDTGINVGSDATILRCDISKFENGIIPGSNCLIQDNYIHDLETWSEGHLDGIAIQGGQANVSIQHNTIMAWDTGNIFIKTDFAAISGVTINNNRILNQSPSKKASRPIYNINGNSNAGPPTGTVITNNWIQKGQYSDNYYWDLAGTVTNYENRDYDTNALIDNAAPTSNRTGTLTRVEANDTLSATSPGGTGTPPPTGNTYPTAATTGYVGTLTASSISATTSNGQVLQNLRFSNTLEVRHSNVIIRNCEIVFGGWWGIDHTAGTNLLVEDCTIRAGTGGAAKGAIGVNLRGGIVRRCNLYGFENAIYFAGSNCQLVNNYVHDLSGASGDGDPHIDGFQALGGVSGNTWIYNNSVTAKDTSCIIMQNEFDGYTGTVNIVNNLLVGNPVVSSIIYARGDKSSSPWAAALVVTNNCMYGGNGILDHTSGPTNITWTGNFDASGGVVNY